MLRQIRLGLLTGRSLQQRIHSLSHLEQQLRSPFLAVGTRSLYSCSSTALRSQRFAQPLRLLTQRLSPYSTVVVQPPRRASRLPRILFFSLLSLGTFTVTFFFGLDHFFPLLPTYLPFMGSHLPTDAETLELFTPHDDITREIDDHIRSHPLVQSLRASGQYVESRPHLKIPAETRGHSLTAGTLTGENKIVVPPLFFNDLKTNTIVSVFYLGSDVSGHPGIVHGGLSATLLDEGLARCCFPALPNKVAVTAMLNVEYKKPAMTGNFFVLRAKTTKVEGRKAWVEGHIEELSGPEGASESENGDSEVLVSAKALFIEPRGAKTFTSLYKVT